jgi:hypothetical protein
VSITLRKMKIFLNNWCFHINGKILIFSRTRRLTNNFKTVLELSGQELTFLYYKFSYEILSLLNPLFNYPKTYAFICNWMCKPGLCIRCRRGTHIIPNLVRGNKVVVMHWGCGTRPLLQGWFREDGLRGQNLNMVLTITTIIAIIQHHFSCILK